MSQKQSRVSRSNCFFSRTSFSNLSHHTRCGSWGSCVCFKRSSPSPKNSVTSSFGGQVPNLGSCPMPLFWSNMGKNLWSQMISSNWICLSCFCFKKDHMQEVETLKDEATRFHHVQLLIAGMVFLWKRVCATDLVTTRDTSERMQWQMTCKRQVWYNLCQTFGTGKFPQNNYIVTSHLACDFAQSL